MHYISVAQAKDMDGLRLVLGVQTPGPWSFCARALFSFRNVPFVPVRQDVMGENADLIEWTGRRNAPVAVYNDETPVDGWLEIANLAERLGSGPSLFPDDPVDRALATGWSAEICGQGGFGWSRRIAMAMAGRMAEGDSPAADVMRGYGVAEENIAPAQRRTADVMRGLAGQLRSQLGMGREWLVGDRIGACDIQWACFSQLVAPLGPDAIQMDDGMRALFSTLSDVERDALDPILIEHRDRVWRDHIGLPVDYLPDEE